MTMKKISQLSNAQTLQLQHLSSAQGAKKNNTKFSDLMEKTIKNNEGVHFSKHAESRIRQRGIDVSEDVMTSLNEAVQKAREKGAKDTVIIGPQGAFIVNVPNNVVVTTISGQELKNNIFTNIDSAVLM